MTGFKALCTVISQILYTAGAAVNISIIGGSEVNIGDKAEIQCSYTEFFLHLPNFIINGVTIESGALETQLRGYDQNHDVTCTNVCSATYTLTLSNVSRGYNGTTYQCSVGQEGAIKSGIVTLIVRGRHRLLTYIHAYILTHTHTNKPHPIKHWYMVVDMHPYPPIPHTLTPNYVPHTHHIAILL